MRRGIIQFAFFIFLPGGFTAAFSGVKYIMTQIGLGEQIELTSFVTVLIVLCAYTVVFGRFFCGYACAFGSLGDAVNAGFTWVCKKLKKKPPKIPAGAAKVLEKFKYVILTAICVACFLGVYSKAKGYNPWDVFSMLHGRNIDNLSSYGIGIVLLVLIIIGMCIQERFFCRFLCPMGAVFALLPSITLFDLSRKRSECIKGCSACTRKCPADIELPDSAKKSLSHECYQCGKCTEICPRQNIQTTIPKLKGNEIWFTIVRAGILAGLLLWLGV